VLYVKGCSSASQALKFARGISLKSKLYSAFVLNCYRVALLRHLVLIVKFVVLRKSSRLTNVAGLLIEYVSYINRVVKEYYLTNTLIVDTLLPVSALKLTERTDKANDNLIY
jgi:hypothetical protein